MASFKVTHKAETDFKLIIKITKNVENIGIGELNIPVSALSKSEKNIKKWITVVDDKKSKKLTTSMDQIKLLMLIDIEYDGKIKIDPISEPPVKKINNLNTSKNKETKGDKLKDIKMFSQNTKTNLNSKSGKKRLNQSINESQVSISKDIIVEKNNNKITLQEVKEKISPVKSPQKSPQKSSPQKLNKKVTKEFQLDDSETEDIFNEEQQNESKFANILKLYTQYYNDDYISLYIFII